MHPFQLGVIEGFYGRQWSWPERQSLPEMLADWGYSAYIYAPKGDSSLRSRWREDFDPGHFARLRSLSESAREAGIGWGVGLSPAGLQAHFTEADGADLRRKLQQIKALWPSQLWILFDDLPAGVPELAVSQLRVVDAVRQVLPDTPLAICPSYYSEDPILESLFGDCPKDYFATLNEGLAEEVDILWTGPRVISTAYDADDMHRAASILGRRPLLWDNYPVNDGKKSSRFLNTLPFSGRPASLKTLTRGHFVNPMNQFHLSLLPLMGLASLYSGKNIAQDTIFKTALGSLPEDMAQILAEYAPMFQNKGLDGMPAALKAAIASRCDRIAHPAAGELAAWLREEYRFDPGCLTE
ncbi:beta-N-acetylglucosaminidase domain-containing protein [Spongiibacter marinus]|uniref:beta-N-acetylglucosaminidase domain-containing protein n=1 Tax=Spongiibacter marinus TaxID=354246 RepID=UPI0004220C22|nr:beta-N-acetylglucosaminidase domain-containing protein [Spongiibacter marinus]